MMKRQLFSVAVFVLILTIGDEVNAASRQPNVRDHLHCKLEYMEQWEEVMQTADPYAVVEAYYVSSIIVDCRLDVGSS